MGDADTVQSDAEPYHVELRFRETLDPGAVVDVPQDVPLREGGDQPVAQFAEQGDLAACEVVVPGFVATGQVREDRADVEFRDCFQRVDQRVDVLPFESEAVHAGVELDVDRIVGFSVPAYRFGERLQRRSAVNLRFEPVVEHQVEAVRIGVQHDDRHRDAGLAQCDAFVGERDGQEADALLFEHVGDFESAVAVAGRLDHRHHLFSFAQQAAEVVQVVDHVVEVDFQYGRMYLVFEDAADPFELEAASSF